MKTHLSSHVRMVVAAGLAITMLASAALGVRSLLTGTAAASPAAPNPGHEWSQVEGHGIDAAGYFLGSTANQALELRVNGQSALRLEPSASSPNVIGGYSGNYAGSGVVGGAVGGGGGSSAENRVTDAYGTVGGGSGNQAGDSIPADSAPFATVGGGLRNTASFHGATVGGGMDNDATGARATVGGGDGNLASAENAVVAGGVGNNAISSAATIAGGALNQVSGNAGTVGGGLGNLASALFTTVAGGSSNYAQSIYATAGGGVGNRAVGQYSTVAGGSENHADGQYATVPGGSFNSATASYSFAAGRRAKANNQGCFVWGDSTDADVACNDNDRFVARASGGVYLYTAGDLSTGAYLAAGSGSWSDVSSRDVKENFTEAEGEQVLAALAEIPITTWNYKSQDESIRHMGPMAQDFYAAFGLGESETAISTVDADGVALAAVQGLYELSQEQAARIQALEEENATLEQRLDNLEERVSALEAGAPPAVAAAGASSGVPATSFVFGGGLGLVVVGLVLAGRRLAGGRR